MMTGAFKHNYLVTDAVKSMGNRFTIKMTEDLKSERAFQLFRGILSIFGVTIEKKENTYIFDAAKGAVNFTLKGPIVYGRQLPPSLPTDSGEITFLVPFYNISPDTLKAIIQSQLPAQATVFPLPDLGVLVLSGNYEDIEYVLSFIDLLDRAQFKDRSIVMIKPEYWGIGEFQQKVQELMVAEGVSFTALENSGGLLFIPIEKMNSLIVISPVKEWVQRVLYWLEKLDIPEAAGEAKKVYAYKLKNVDAESVVDVLQAYRTGSMPSKPVSSFSRKRALQTSGSNQGEKTDKPTETPGEKPSTPRYSKPGSSSPDGSNEKAIDDVAIVPIYENNSIVIVAAPVDYKKYLDIIKHIDVPRSQVFVEVIIGEVSLDRATQLGLEFWVNRYLNRGAFGTKGGLGVYKGTDTAGNRLLPSGSNLFMNGTLPGSQFEVLINALVENSKINIVSTPKITVMENEEAEISVGSDVPVISSEAAIGTSQTGGVGSFYPFRSVQYINTGIILKVRAAILSGSKISLEIVQEISEALENKTSDISSPEILKRTVKTTLVVQEGEIAFIGGLFQDKLSTSGSGVPLLSRIPLLGNLFKNDKRQIKKTELVVFINSRIIRKSNDMKEIVEGVKKIFSNRVYTETSETQKRENK